MSEWKRPVFTEEYPKVYVEFEGKLVVNGKRRKYWIQDLTEEYFDEVVKTYTTYFLDDEPLCKHTGCINDPECVQEFSGIWHELLRQKISLICLTKDDEGKVKIAGFNCLYAVRKSDKDDSSQLKNNKTKKVVEIMEHLGKQRDAFKEFQVDEYVAAMGLYVCLAYRGEGLGQVLLGTRKLVAKDVGFKVTLTVFTSAISQKQAARVGFDDFVTISYDDLEKINPEFALPGIQKVSKLCKLMYRRIE